MAARVDYLARRLAGLLLAQGDAAGSERAVNRGLLAGVGSVRLWQDGLDAAAAGFGYGLERAWDDTRELLGRRRRTPGRPLPAASPRPGGRSLRHGLTSTVTASTGHRLLERPRATVRYHTSSSPHGSSNPHQTGNNSPATTSETASTHPLTGRSGPARYEAPDHQRGSTGPRGGAPSTTTNSVADRRARGKKGPASRLGRPRHHRRYLHPDPQNVTRLCAGNRRRAEVEAVENRFCGSQSGSRRALQGHRRLFGLQAAGAIKARSHTRTPTGMPCPTPPAMAGEQWCNQAVAAPRPRRR